MARAAWSDGRRLWLKAEGWRQTGWALADQVIPLEQAMAFFTDRIRSNPQDAFAHAVRAGLGLDPTWIGSLFTHVDLVPSQESSFGHSRFTALAPATRET